MGEVQDAPTVVFVPGLGLTHESVAPTVLRGRAHWRADVVRLPGYGDPVRRGSDVSPERLARRLLAVLDVLAASVPSPVVLVGHSASCQVVAEAAAADPGRIAGLVLIGPTTDPRAQSWPGLVLRWLRTAVWERPWQVPSLARQYSRTGLRGMAVTMDAARRHDIRRPLSRLAVPTVVVRGRRDRIAPGSWVQGSASLAGGRAVSLDAGGHMVVLTHPAEVAAIITELVRAAAPERGGAGNLPPL
jgi:pimeloyl-ACP methyl ester carboxylesterase